MTSESINPLARGPFVQAALLCDQVIEGNDGVLTIIRVVDRINHRVPRPDAPEEMEPFSHQLTMVIMLKAGVQRGSHTLSVNLVRPDFEPAPMPGRTVFMEGEDDRGQNIISRMVMIFPMPGLYWFEIGFDGHTLTKIPLRIVYFRGP